MLIIRFSLLCPTTGAAKNVANNGKRGSGIKSHCSIHTTPIVAHIHSTIIDERYAHRHNQLSETKAIGDKVS